MAAVAGCSEPSDVNPTGVVPTPSEIAGDDAAEVLRVPTPSDRDDDERELVETSAPPATLEPTSATVPDATPTASTASTPTATATSTAVATATPSRTAVKVRHSSSPDATETVAVDLNENEVATDEVQVISVTPTPVPTPVRTIPSTAEAKQSASDEGDGLQATTTPGPTTVVEIERVVEVIVVGNDVAQNDSETDVPAVATLETDVSEPPTSESEGIGSPCYRVTGACQNLDFKEPITVSMPCEGRFTLRESRRGRETHVTMCARELSIVSEEELDLLRNYVFVLVKDVTLGSTYLRMPDAIRITGVHRFEPGEDDWRCDDVPAGIQCLRVELEITNVAEGEKLSVFSDEDFSVVDEFDEIQQTKHQFGKNSDSLATFSSREVPLLAGERFQTAVVRYIPQDSRDLYLSFRDVVRFSLGSEDNWMPVSEVGAPQFQTRRKENLKHTMQCGWEYIRLDKVRVDVFGVGYGLEEIDRCDPNVATVPPDELARVENMAVTGRADRSKPVALQQLYKSNDHAIRVMAVRRHEDQDTCGYRQNVPLDFVCIGIEFEVTRLLSAVGPQEYDISDFVVLGSSGIAYYNRPYENVYLYDAVVHPGQRLQARIARFVPPGEEYFVMIYDNRHTEDDLAAFWLTEYAPFAERENPSESIFQLGTELGSVGTSIANPVAYGDPQEVHSFEIRVVEAERGWIPEEDCCAGRIPEVLLVTNQNEMLTGLVRHEADERLSNDPLNVQEYVGPAELVRVRFEAKRSGDFNEVRQFNAKNVILVDSERRIYAGGFYPREESLLRQPYFYGPTGFDWPDGHRARLAAIFGGGTVYEELAWMVPESAKNLTLAYVPFKFEPGQFFALDVAESPREFEESPTPAWIQDAIDHNETSLIRPALKGTGVRYLDDVAVRISGVTSSRSPCKAENEPLSDHECLRVELEFAVESSKQRRGLFGNDDVLFVIDDEYTYARETEGGWYRSTYGREFDSELDWVEINGRGSVKVTYEVEAREGWRFGALVYSPHRQNPPVYLSLNESHREVEEETDDYDVDVVATVTAVSSTVDKGLLEYLDEVGFEWTQEDEEPSGLLVDVAFKCAAYSVKPTADSESEVLESIVELSATRISEIAPDYFEDADNAAIFCGTAFPDSSKLLVLAMLVTISAIDCFFGGQGGIADEYGELLLDYWGEQAPVSMSDFDGITEFCEWLLDEENDDLRRLFEDIDDSLPPTAQ